MLAESRRAFLRRAAALPVLAGASGCTAFVPTDATVRFVNGLRDVETAEYAVHRGETRRASGSARLAADEEYTVSHSMLAGDRVVVTKGDNELSFQLESAVCPSPVLEVDIGGGIAGSWTC